MLHGQQAFEVFAALGIPCNVREDFTALAQGLQHCLVAGSSDSINSLR